MHLLTTTLRPRSDKNQQSTKIHNVNVKSLVIHENSFSGGLTCCREYIHSIKHIYRPTNTCTQNEANKKQQEVSLTYKQSKLST